MSPPDSWKDDRKVGGGYKGQWPRHLLKLTHAYNSTRSAVTSYSPHLLMFGQCPRLPIDFVFPTHKIMGTLRLVDNYMAELITALKKSFELAQNLTQVEASRQKWRHNQRASTVTLNLGEVVLVKNDQVVGKSKIKDHWGYEVYTVHSQVDVDMPVYIIKNQ